MSPIFWSQSDIDKLIAYANSNKFCCRVDWARVEQVLPRFSRAQCYQKYYTIHKTSKLRGQDCSNSSNCSQPIRTRYPQTPEANYDSRCSRSYSFSSVLIFDENEDISNIEENKMLASLDDYL